MIITFRIFYFILLFNICYVYCEQQLKTGKECVLSGKSNKGQCVPFQQCPEASLKVDNKEIPQKCGIANEVCCEKPKIVGEISKQKCQDYSSVVFETVESSVGEITNQSTCVDSSALILGGTDAQNREFPHMALLGFEDNMDWFCGAALISEQFLLTSAHCTSSRESGSVRRIRLGVTRFSENEKETYADFSVAAVFVHPNYSLRSKHNDIALIKMDRPTKFNKFIRPACLNVNLEIPQQKYFKTTWVSTRIEEQNVQMELHKLIAKSVSNDECSASIKNATRRIEIDPNTQLCAKLGEDSRFFQDSTGGPLQVYHPDIYCMHSIIGVVSFEFVNNKNIPDVYTRVSNYTEWIEKIVWP